MKSELSSDPADRSSLPRRGAHQEKAGVLWDASLRWPPPRQFIPPKSILPSGGDDLIVPCQLPSGPRRTSPVGTADFRQ